MQGWTFINYGTTCDNLDMALTIVKSDEASTGDKFIAGTYIAVEGAAHTALTFGTSACFSNPAVCLAGGKAFLGIGSTVAEVACADWDFGNELNASLKTAESVVYKLQNYLLNPNHPDGGNKARWFEQALGYTKENLSDLARQIIFDPNKAVETSITIYGTKYTQVITIIGANGKQLDVIFAWIKNLDGIVRLVTGIPTSK